MKKLVKTEEVNVDVKAEDNFDIEQIEALAKPSLDSIKNAFSMDKANHMRKMVEKDETIIRINDNIGKYLKHLGPNTSINVVRYNMLMDNIEGDFDPEYVAVLGSLPIARLSAMVAGHINQKAKLKIDIIFNDTETVIGKFYLNNKGQEIVLFYLVDRKVCAGAGGAEFIRANRLHPCIENTHTRASQAFFTKRVLKWLDKPETSYNGEATIKMTVGSFDRLYVSIPKLKRALRFKVVMSEIVDVDADPTESVIEHTNSDALYTVDAVITHDFT